MDKEEIKQEIKKLELYIKRDDTKRASLLLKLILTTMGILAGGVLLGSILGEMAVCMVTAVLACVPLEATNYMQYREFCNDINRYLDQIETYNKELNAPQVVKKEVSKVTKEAPKKTQNYAYNKEKEVQKKREIPIEFFDESDFDDEVVDNNHKRR